MIKWVVFDIGGVVIDITPDGTISKLSELSTVSRDIVAKLFAPSAPDSGKTFVEQFAVGQISIDEYINQMQKQFPQPISREDLIAAEMLVPGPDKRDTIDLIKELKSHVSLACFSNTHKLHWDDLLANRSWYSNFTHVFASHTEQLLKPDPEVFRFMEKRLNATADECVFVDDAEKNVRAAHSCGWHAVQFYDAAQLRRELVKLRVLA